MQRRTVLALGAAAVPLCIAAFGRGASIVLDTRGPAVADEAGDRTRTVVVSTFGSDGAALQRAINSDAGHVVVDIDVAISADVMLKSGQRLSFVGGRLVVRAGAAFARAILSGKGPDIVIADPVIDARAMRTGATGIALRDADRARITGGRLIRASLKIESHDNTEPRSIAVTGLVVDMAGWQTTAIYVSGVRGVTISNVECFGGKEGVGIYNAARNINLHDVVAHGHKQDGFVVIAGQQLAFVNCQAENNGQSGFTTQRLIEGNDTRHVKWYQCSASGNGFDGFDMRGAADTSWNISTGFELSSCTARANKRCGFYIVMAEGTMLSDCAATRNDAQNLFIDRSDDVVVQDFRSVSGAAIIASGPNKAGILIYDSRSVRLERPVSRNSGKVTQEFGLSLTGRSANARLRGGDLDGRVRATYAAVGVLATE